jgi:uncharacterized protein YegJ (DUF2314 family)
VKFQLCRPLLLLPLVLASCATQQSVHPIGREVIRRSAEPECFQIKEEDSEMARAVKQARKTEHVFIAALKNPQSGQRDFEVKKPFVQGDAVEHIWLRDVTYSGHRFHGIVDNRPHSIKGVKMGDRVSVNPSEITDWAYVDHGKLVGGYTIRVLYGEFSPERRAAFEKEAGFRIEKE